MPAMFGCCDSRCDRRVFAVTLGPGGEPMESVCTAIPLKPGMWEVIRQHRDDIVNGLNKDEEAYAKEHRGFRTVKVFHQTTPIEALVLYFEAENLEETFHTRHQDHASLEKRQAFWTQVAGLEAGQFMAELPQLLIDWHHEEGHRPTAAPSAPNS